MTIEIQIMPPTFSTRSGPQQACGESGNFCYVNGANFTTGLCGTWLGLENYCCAVSNLGEAGAPSSNTCGSVLGIHDTNVTNFGSATLKGEKCPSSATQVNFVVGDDDAQCCHYDNYYRIDEDIASVFYYPDGILGNLTIRCLNLTTQGMASSDDSGSSYSGTKSGNSNSGSGSGGGSGSGSGSGKPNGVGLLNVPNCLLGGALMLMAVAAQL
ncbi:hypothetical protein TWF694_007201 [Orbilia ellipsospora]|uniref:Uncharacterized protein n=1 Tax=Orbilia ellipsospora TaxID=2528407 RepID=A0AAV9XH09_9PEZI